MNFSLDSFEIQERDKKVILLALAAILLAVSYYLGYKNLTSDIEKYDKAYTELKVREDDLREKMANQERYEKTIVDDKAAYAKIMSSYSSNITQTSEIEFINILERATDAWISSVSLGTATPIYTFGQLESANPSTEGAPYKTDDVGYKTTMTIAYTAEYDQWKDLVQYINNYFSKNVIENISMTYADSTGEVSGSMTLGLYSISGSDTQYVEPEFDIQTGTDNIFTSEEIKSTNKDKESGDYILGTYSYYLFLNPASSSVGTCILGKKNDVENATVLTDKSSGTKDVKIVFEGTAGKYRVTYSVGAQKYSSDAEFSKAIDYLIMSSARTDASDDVTANIEIENNTDLPMNVKILNDDVKARANIKTTKGEIAIY